MKPSVSEKEGRSLSVLIGDARVYFSLDAVGIEKQLERERQGYAFQPRNSKDKMRLTFLSHSRSDKTARSWQDSGGDRLENHLREIAVELIVQAEQSYRGGMIYHRELLIQRKAEVEERERKRQIEADRQRKERQAKLEKARVDHLLGQVETFHRAGLIRTYVAAIHQANKSAPQPMSDEELKSWSEWALGQADRIDPVVSGRYKTRPVDSNRIARSDDRMKTGWDMYCSSPSSPTSFFIILQSPNARGEKRHVMIFQADSYRFCRASAHAHLGPQSTHK
jgi:hypothetical protein